MHRVLAVVGGLAMILASGAVTAAPVADESPWPAPTRPPDPPPPPELQPPKPPDNAELERISMEWLKTVRLIEIKSLRPAEEKLWAQGVQDLQAIKDDLAIGPLVSVLYTINPKYRALLTDLLARFAARHSDVAKAYLQEIAVGDAEAGHRQKAVGALKAAAAAAESPPATDRLLVHLALDQVAVFRDRAATALAALGEKRAIRLLAERLVTEEYKLSTAETEPNIGYNLLRASATGAPAFRQVTVQAAGAGGAVASVAVDLPQVDIADYGAVRLPEIRTEVQRIVTQHPEILAALRLLTGKDLGYDAEAWKKWFATAEGAKIVPAWEAMKLKAE
jgi:hypothetical protein